MPGCCACRCATGVPGKAYQLSFFECYGSVFSGVLLSLVVGGFFAGAEASRLVTQTKEVRDGSAWSGRAVKTVIDFS